MASYSCEWHGQLDCDVFRFHVFLIAEDDDGPLGGWKREEKPLDVVHERSGCAGSDGGSVIFVPLLDNGRAATGGAAAEAVSCAMTGDAAKPGDEVLLAGKARQVAVQIKEDVLGDFLGGSAIAEDAKGDGVDARLVAVQDFCELIGSEVQTICPDFLVCWYIRKTGREMMQKFFRDQRLEKQKAQEGP